MEKIAGIVVVLGLMVFAALYACLSYYLRRIGVSPADVGYSYGATLTMGWGLIALTTALLALAYWAGSGATDAERHGPLWKYNTLIVVTYVSVIAVLALMTDVIPDLVGHRAAELREGKRVTPITIGWFTLLDLRASPVKLDWTTGKPLIDIDKNTTPLYLGGTNGVDVLYVKGKGVVRVPASQVTLTVLGDH